MSELQRWPLEVVHPLDRLELDHSDQILATPTPWDEAVAAMYTDDDSLEFDAATAARLAELDLKPESYTDEEMEFIEQCHSLSGGVRQVLVQDAAFELGRQLDDAPLPGDVIHGALAHILKTNWAIHRDVRDFEEDRVRADVAGAALQVLYMYPHPRDAEQLILEHCQAQAEADGHIAVRETPWGQLQACDVMLGIIYGNRYRAFKELFPDNVALSA